MKKIPLNNGQFFIVDDEDYPVLSRFSWHFSKKDKYHTFPRTAHSVTQDNGKKITRNLPIDIFLTVNRNGKRPIPIDGNYLNCRKSNIKLVHITRQKQLAKKTDLYMGDKPTSKYKGVSFLHSIDKWRAYIREPRSSAKKIGETSKQRKQINLGCYDTEHEAAIAYNKKAKELYGEYAYQNIIEN